MVALCRAKGFCKKMIKTPMFYFCLSFILINIFFTRSIVENAGIDCCWIVVLIEVMIEVVTLFLLYHIRRRGASLQKQFLLVAGILGILFIFVMPPGQAPDEITHFRRAYGISEGVLIPGNVNGNEDEVGSLLPNNLEETFGKGLPKGGTYSQIKDMLGNNEIPGYTEQKYNGAAVYNFVCYIPQTLAILIGKLFGFSILGMAYLIELFNFIVWIILVYFAIKLIPKFKEIVLFISLLPIVLQEATSMSPDALTIGLSLFLVAYVLYLTYIKKSKLRKRELALLCGIAIVMGFCKIVYLPLLLLFITIPSDRFGGKKKKWLFLAVLAVVIIALNLAWLMVSASVSVGFKHGTDPKAQMMWMVGNPFDYWLVILNTIDAYMLSWMNVMLGMSLGAFVFNISNVFFLISFAIFIMLFLHICGDLFMLTP